MQTQRRQTQKPTYANRKACVRLFRGSLDTLRQNASDPHVSCQCVNSSFEANASPDRLTENSSFNTVVQTVTHCVTLRQAHLRKSVRGFVSIVLRRNHNDSLTGQRYRYQLSTVLQTTGAAFLIGNDHSASKLRSGS